MSHPQEEATNQESELTPELLEAIKRLHNNIHDYAYINKNLCRNAAAYLNNLSECFEMEIRFRKNRLNERKSRAGKA